MDDVITTEQIMERIRQQQHLNFTPGTQFMYSNTGYTLLAKIVEVVSGKSFSEFTHEAIFQPLGMEHTQFLDDHEKLVKNRAYSYYKENDIYKKRVLSYANVGATSLFTTAEDLTKWALNFDRPQIGSAKLLQRFNQLATLDNGAPAILNVIDGETIYHAKGQFYRNHRGLDLYNHTGSDAGFKTYLGRFPEERLAVVVLGNEENINSLNTGLATAALYLQEAFKPKIISEAAKALETKSTVVTSNLAQFEGEYYSAVLETKYVIKKENEQLILSQKRLEDIVLTQVGPNTFKGINTFEFTIEFITHTSENTEFTISNFGAKHILFERIK